MTDKKGFTLMETLAVIFIMAVIAGIMLPALRRVREGGRVTHARNEINQLIAAIQMYAEDWGDYPVADSTAVLLDALEDYSHWPAIVKDETTGELLDPWGRHYRYRYPGSPEFRAIGVAFNLYSAGPDGEYGTEHDITNW
jgi:general secretion pathway protein G